jgi:ribosomal protein S18 acetylase RimI-like enzyme
VRLRANQDLTGPADALDRRELAELFTAGYEGYFVPLRVDEAMLDFMVAAWDIDLARSRVARRDEEPVGVALLALRDDDAWIGGLGVVPAARRTGLGRRLMEAVLAEAPGPVRLEVIEQNDPAIRLYEKLGFERTRLLEVWSLTAEPPPSPARAAEADAAHAWIVDRRRERVPWQRDDASLDVAALEALEVEGGAALFRVAGGRISIQQLEARDAAAAAELLAAARARGSSLHYVNVPEGDPASEALAALGGSLDLRQLEMTLAR